MLLIHMKKVLKLRTLYKQASLSVNNVAKKTGFNYLLEQKLLLSDIFTLVNNVKRS